MSYLTNTTFCLRALIQLFSKIFHLRKQYCYPYDVPYPHPEMTFAKQFLF